MPKAKSRNKYLTDESKYPEDLAIHGVEDFATLEVQST